MAEAQELSALPIEQLEQFVNSRSLSIVPNTETSPGVTEEGTVQEASANMVPTPDPISASPIEEPILGGLDTADRRRQAVLSRIQNSRLARDTQEGIA